MSIFSGNDDNEVPQTGGVYRPQTITGPLGPGKWETNPAKINAYLATAKGDPSYQQALRSGGPSVERWLHDRGYGVTPNTHRFNPETGQVQDKSWWEKNGNWVKPLGIWAVAASAPYAFGYGGEAGVLPATVTPQAMSTLPAAGAGGFGPTTVAAATTLAGGATLPGVYGGGNQNSGGNAPGGGNVNGGGNGPGVNPGGMDWQNLLTKVGLAGGLMGMGQAFGPDAPAPPVMPQMPTMPEMPPEMREIMALQRQRLEAQNPLYASILQLAKQRMPTSVQNAQLPGGNAAQQTTVQQLGGWGKA